MAEEKEENSEIFLVSSTERPRKRKNPSPCLVLDIGKIMLTVLSSTYSSQGPSRTWTSTRKSHKKIKIIFALYAYIFNAATKSVVVFVYWMSQRCYQAICWFFCSACSSDASQEGRKIFTSGAWTHLHMCACCSTHGMGADLFLSLHQVTRYRCCHAHCWIYTKPSGFLVSLIHTKVKILKRLRNYHSNFPWWDPKLDT